MNGVTGTPNSSKLAQMLLDLRNDNTDDLVNSRQDVSKLLIGLETMEDPHDNQVSIFEIGYLYVFQWHHY